MSLIYSKIRLPRWRPNLLSRPHLVENLRSNLSRKLIVVVAPAGYGKTTLLLDFAHHADVSVSWYSLDEGDRDPRVFIEYLIAGLRLRSPEFGTRTLDALQDFRATKEEIARIVGVLVNELYETFSDDCIILLDNFEIIDDSPDVGRFLEAFLRYLPDHIRIVLASRTFPQRSAVTLPLIATGDVAGVSGHLLKFTPEEVMALAEQVYRRPIDRTTATDMVETSEGWIMGIQLSSHALWRGQLDAILPSQSNQDLLYEYVTDQILKPLPVPQQDFLLRSSILVPLTIDLTNTALGIDDAEARLRRLSDELPMFIQPLDSEGTYRYHGLFSQFLRQTLTQDETRAQDAHRRAGQAQAERGQLVEAVRHYLAAHDFMEAGRIAGRTVDELYQTGRWETLRTLMDELPAAARTPELLIADAMRLREQGDMEQALKVLADAERHGDATWSTIAHMRRAAIWSLQGRHSAAIDVYTDVLQRLDASNGLLLGEVYRGLGRCHFHLRQLDSAIEHLRQSLDYYSAEHSTHNIAHVYHELGEAYAAQGYLDRAQTAYQTALAHSEEIGARGWRINTLSALAHILYEQEKHNEAISILDQCLIEAQAFGYLKTETWVRLYIGSILTQIGRLPQGLQALQETLSLAQQIELPHLVIYSLDAIGNNLRLQDKFDQAQLSLQSSLALADKLQLPYETAVCHLSLGVLALDQGVEDMAHMHLEICHSGFSQTNARRELMVTEFHRGRLAYNRRNTSQAAACLDLAASLAIETKSQQLLLQSTARAWSLIRWAISHTAHREFWEQIYLKHRQTATQTVKTNVLPLEILAFGKSHIRVQGEEAVAEWTSLRELFFFLLHHQPKGVRRDVILDTFWPDTPPSKAGQALKVALHRLRRSICETYHEAGWYSLVLPDGYFYDAGSFTTLIAGIDLAGPITAEQAQTLRQALTYYKGDYLTEYYSDWVQSEREHLKSRYLQILMTLGAYHEKRHEYQPALEFYQKTLAADEYQEATHQALMRCYLALGDRGRAVQHFREMSQVLKRDLGIEPAAETQRLYRKIVEDAS